MSVPPVTLSALQNQCHVFSNLPKRYLVELETSDAIRIYRLDAGEGLTLRADESSHDALFLLQGQAEIRRDGMLAGSAAQDDSPCRAVPLAGAVTEITAVTTATVCRAARDQLDYLTSWSVMLANLPAGDDKLRDRLSQLRYPAIFMNLPAPNVVRAFECMTSRKVGAGDEIIRQGEAGDDFFIIESGTAEVWQQGAYDDEQQLVAQLGPGHHFGDEALVTGGTRNATVRMTEDGTLSVLSRDDFKELISSTMVTEVDYAAAKSLADKGYRYLDVRYEEEWEDGHIPDAILVPLPDLRKRLGELDRNAKYLAYCLSGKRSAVGAMILKQHGLDAVCLKDGLRDWPYETVSEY